MTETLLCLVRSSILGARVVGALLFVACGPLAVPGTPPTLAGVVVSVNGGGTAGGRAPTVHVKATADDPCGIIFSVEAGTEILARDGRDRLSAVPLDSLGTGRNVRVWSGPVAESCPAQSQALTIELLATEGA